MWWEHCLDWCCMGMACYDMSFHAIITSKQALWRPVQGLIGQRNEDIAYNRVPDSSRGCFSVAEGNNITVAAFRMFI